MLHSNPTIIGSNFNSGMGNLNDPINDYLFCKINLLPNRSSYDISNNNEGRKLVSLME